MNSFIELHLERLLKAPNESNVFCWLTGIPTEQRVPGEFYAVRIEVPATASLVQFHEKFLLALEQMNGYLREAPPLINPFKEEL